MPSRSHTLRLLPLLFWILALAAIPIWGTVEQPRPGWDLHVYANAIRSLKAGHDPYSDGIAVQDAFHHSPQAHDPTVMPPYTYVYSPLTLPALREIGAAPLQFSGWLYCLIYGVGMLMAVWVGMQAATPTERPLVALIAPAAIFFPGLIQNDVLFSGNVAYILYGLVFAAALRGWRKDRWELFYIATLAVSILKAPLLTLLAIPLLSARRPWVPAGVTAALGLAAFAIQPVLWPSQVRHYLQAVSLQFSYNHDFGFSPAGVLGEALARFHLPYSAATTLFYVVYAIPLFATLLYLSRKFLEGCFPLAHWIPVMLVGVILLNPRIKEYDVACLTIPMALIAWRLFDRGTTKKRSAWEMALFFAFLNAFGAGEGFRWRTTECILLAGLFLAGSWNLLEQIRMQAIAQPEPASVESVVC